MDESLALKLNSRSDYYDSELYRRCARAAADYAQNGLQTLSYFLQDFDAANDLANALASLPTSTTAAQFDKLDRSATRNFSHPAGATQIDVLATAVSQILFGGETARRVEARRDDEEGKSDAMNQLLAWNDQQNKTYHDGFCWVKDAIIFNRGVQYDYWCDLYETQKEPVEYEIPLKQKRKNDPASKKVTRWRTVKKKIGGYTKIVNISPYDFICDTAIPLGMLQERGRFAGHRVIIPWTELKRRSELPVEDYQYVLPEVVKKLKNQKSRKGITGLSPGVASTSNSRSYFERIRRGNPTPDIGLQDRINREDGGTVECFVVYIRTRPKTYGIYEDDEDELIEFLIAGDSDLLSVNVMTNRHGQFPYCVAEARPNAHQQFGPSVALIMKPTQDQIDSRKWRHEEQVERSGIMFLADATKCDIEQVLTDKSRMRQAITVTEDGKGTPFDQIIKQIPVNDTTAGFMDEILYWKREMEEASGAQAQIQGKTEDPSQTLGQYQDVAQMAMGRISTMARNLSSAALMDQTKRIAMNAQQWMPDVQEIRITGQGNEDYDPDVPPPKFMMIRRDPTPDEVRVANESYKKSVQAAMSTGSEVPTPPPELLHADAVDIQFEFDVIAHDGAMPGVNARAVAAASRLIEAAANPAFQQCFDDSVPGNFDPRALLTYVAKESGMPVKNFRITTETAQRNLKMKLNAQGVPQLPPGAQPQGPQAPATPENDAAALAGAPSAEPPQATGAVLPQPQL